MNAVKTAQSAHQSFQSSRESITVGSAACKSLSLSFINFRLVCGSCSGNSWYAPGYSD